MSKKARGKRRPDPSGAKTHDAPWNAPMSRRDFVKAGIAVGGVAGASAMAVGGRGSLQALQIAQPAQQAAVTDSFAARLIKINVNGMDYKVNVEPRDMLVNVLRDSMGLIATKRPCNRMECGGCTVLIDNVPYNSCQYPALRAGDGKKILTAEAGLGSDSVVAALQKAWVVADAGQCSYCSPGFIMAATALLKSNPNPTDDDIKKALSGNICRCGVYVEIIEAVQQASANLRGSGA